MKKKPAYLALMVLLGLLALPVFSAWSGPPPELQAVYDQVEAAKQIGPQDIPLRDQAVLKLPRGYLFIPVPAAADFMRAMGNTVDERFLGLVAADEAGADWLVAVEYVDSGYIKDDEAKTWNVDELLDSYKKGTEAANQERAERGFPQLEVTGWVEPPLYDDSTRRLVWSMAVRHKGSADNSGESVNYNTYALGRDGYISLNLVTDLRSVNGLKPVATELLAALQFNEGKRYADFNASTDKVAEYGLAALVGGLAAKKLGLLAVAAAFFAKFAKLIIAGLAVSGTVLGKWLGRKKSGKDAT